MDDFNKTHDNALAAVGETVLNPISLYSDKAKKVEDIPEASKSPSPTTPSTRPAACCCSSPPA